MQGEDFLEIVEPWPLSDKPQEESRVHKATVATADASNEDSTDQDMDSFEALFEEMEHINLPQEYERMQKSKVGLKKGFLGQQPPLKNESQLQQPSKPC